MRWRLYRYKVGDVFKPHTDGAWPGSGVKMMPTDDDNHGDGRLVPTLVRVFPCLSQLTAMRPYGRHLTDVILL